MTSGYRAQQPAGSLNMANFWLPGGLPSTLKGYVLVETVCICADGVCNQLTEPNDSCNAVAPCRDLKKRKKALSAQALVNFTSHRRSVHPFWVARKAPQKYQSVKSLALHGSTHFLNIRCDAIHRGPLYKMLKQAQLPGRQPRCPESHPT